MLRQQVVVKSMKPIAVATEICIVHSNYAAATPDHAAAASMSWRRTIATPSPPASAPPQQQGD